MKIRPTFARGAGWSPASGGIFAVPQVATSSVFVERSMTFSRLGRRFVNRLVCPCPGCEAEGLTRACGRRAIGLARCRVCLKAWLTSDKAPVKLSYEKEMRRKGWRKATRDGPNCMQLDSGVLSASHRQRKRRPRASRRRVTRANGTCTDSTSATPLTTCRHNRVLGRHCLFCALMRDLAPWWRSAKLCQAR